MAVKVVDASALAALLFGEPAAEDVASRLGEAVLAAPALIEYEIGNACWKKCRRHPAMADALRAALAALPAMDLRLHDVDAAGVLELARRRDITFYAASYLWLAERLGAPLVTLDARLTR